MEDEALNTQPVQDVSEEQNEQPVETNIETETTEVEEAQQSETTEAPKEVEDEVLDDPTSTYAPYVQPQPYQFNQKDGYVDPAEVAAQIEQRVLQQVTFQRQEAKQWESIEKKHPQVKTDKNLRELILNQRIAEAVQGKPGNLSKIADNLMSQFGTAKSEGRAEANVSKKVQKAASLETSTSNAGEQKGNDVMDRISRGDQTATSELLNDWISRGLI